MDLPCTGREDKLYICTFSKALLQTRNAYKRKGVKLGWVCVFDTYQLTLV